MLKSLPELPPVPIPSSVLFLMDLHFFRLWLSMIPASTSLAAAPFPFLSQHSLFPSSSPELGSLHSAPHAAQAAPAVSSHPPLTLGSVSLCSFAAPHQTLLLVPR